MRKIQYTGINKVEVVNYEPTALAAGHIRVRHLYSLISAGTEKLMLEGVMGRPQDLPAGYCALGRITEGWQDSGFGQGDLVFTHGVHAETIDVSLADAKKIFIPVSSKFAKQATFLQLGKVAMHGLHKVNIKIGDWIVVFGLGVVGNLSAQLAGLQSAGRVIGIDPIENRRKIAEKVGIKTLDPGNGDLAERISDITGGGANIIIETSGSPAALAQTFQIAAYGGQISLVAGHYGTRQLDMKTDFLNKELAIFGARRVDVYSRSTDYDRWTVVKCAEEIYKMIEAGVINVEPLITHCIEPENAPQIYKRLIDNDESMLGVIFAWEKE